SVLTVSDMRRRHIAIGLLASALVFGVLGGPVGTSALPQATLVGGAQDGPVGTTVVVNLSGFSNTSAPTGFWNGKTLQRTAYTTDLDDVPDQVTLKFQSFALPPVS